MAGATTDADAEADENPRWKILLCYVDRESVPPEFNIDVLIDVRPVPDSFDQTNKQTALQQSNFAN